jgi:uncharacterized damage-inducible protein DinB
MPELDLIRRLFEYTDWSNGRLIESAAPLGEDALDRPMEIGPGTLRRTLVHICNGERVWLGRFRQDHEVPWPSEAELVPVAVVGERLDLHARERDGFLSTLSPADLDRVQTYRDSKGSLYRAPLRDMLLQGVLHSKHHQAQAVNILRRLGAAWPELDYMYRVRRPA